MEESIEESQDKKNKKISTRFNLRSRKWPCPAFPKTIHCRNAFMKSPKHAKKIEIQALLAQDAP
jgi:hypothetical protein